jgi:hypothetical protein
VHVLHLDGCLGRFIQRKPGAGNVVPGLRRGEAQPFCRVRCLAALRQPTYSSVGTTPMQVVDMTFGVSNEGPSHDTCRDEYVHEGWQIEWHVWHCATCQT